MAARARRLQACKLLARYRGIGVQSRRWRAGCRLDEAVDLFLDHLQGRARARASTRSTATAATSPGSAQFLAERGRADVDDVTAADITDYLIELAEAGLAARSPRPRAGRDPRAVSRTWSPSAGSRPIRPR